MKLKGIIIGIMTALIVLFFYNGLRHSSQPPEEVHFHAGFIVYEDNQKLNFTDLQYMHVNPCSDEEQEEHTKEEEQLEKAHLHDSVGDVVHVHRNTATWNDLFINMNFALKEPVIGYINGEFVKNILSQPIKAYDSVTILTGENTDVETKIRSAVSREHIEEAEAKTETC